LGVNVMRRELGEDVHRAISQGLRDSIAWAHANVDEALDYAMRYGRGIDKETCRRFVLMYVNNYTPSLGPGGRAAVERLFTMARDRGLIGEIPALDPIWYRFRIPYSVVRSAAVTPASRLSVPISSTPIPFADAAAICTRASKRVPPQSP